MKLPTPTVFEHLGSNPILPKCSNLDLAIQAIFELNPDVPKPTLIRALWIYHQSLELNLKTIGDSL